jgi:predicted GNAT family N-acyltransferase
MTLTILSVTHADIPKCIALRVASLGSLAIGRLPPYAGYVEAREASLRNDLDHRPHVHPLKVVDDDTDEIVAYAKYEIYPQGRQDLEELKRPMDEVMKNVDAFGALREVAHKYFCDRDGGEIAQGPHIRKSAFPMTQSFPLNVMENMVISISSVLAVLITSEEHRCRGAGGMLVQWGIEKSEELGLPGYLQSTEEGRRLYRKHGFEDLDTVEFHLEEYGLKGQGIERMTEMIRYPTKVSNA